MRLVEAAIPTFARHETFHPRYGWFRKAYAAAADDPFVFSQPDAPVVLGVGKNMVRAIRFWGLAAKLIVEDPEPANRRQPGLIPTRFGHALFGEGGWDRYMEDPGTLWLLHWRLLAPSCRVPVWWSAFHEFEPVEFTDHELADAAVTRFLPDSWATPHPSSINKDVTALLRTYAPAEQTKRQSIDDILDCPLRELNLICRAEATNRFRFVLGPKMSLPSAIVAYATLDWIARSGLTGNTVTLGRLATEPGSIGRAFRLTEGELFKALEPTVDSTNGLNLTSPTGALQLMWSTLPARAAIAVLDAYYGTSAADSDSLCGGYDSDQPISHDLLRALGLGLAQGDLLRRLHGRQLDDISSDSLVGASKAELTTSVAQR